MTDTEAELCKYFSTTIQEAIISQCQVDRTNGLICVLANYVDAINKIPGIPGFAELEPDDAYAMGIITNFNPITHFDWDGFKRACKLQRDKELEHLNPFLGHAYNKTEDRPNTWAGDTTGLSDQKRGILDEHLKLSSPMRGTMESRFAQPPVNDPVFMEEFAQFVVASPSMFFWALGDDDTNPEWRWGPCLCMLAGLGLPFLRRVAAGMQHEPAWQFWASATDEELIRDVLEAHKIHGYPCGLLRVEWHRISAVLSTETLTQVNGAVHHPRWLKAVLAAHLFRHCRLISNWGGQPVLVAGYQGKRNYIALGDKAVHSTLKSRANVQNCGDLCAALGVPRVTSKKATWFEELPGKVLSLIRPDNFARVRNPEDKTDLLLPPRVRIGSVLTKKDEYKWIDPGAAVWGVARLNMDTGVITKNAEYSEHDVLMYNWPLDEVSPTLLRSWDSNVPEYVPDDKTPWAILSQHVKNINTLGHDKGIGALFNATILLDLMRPRLTGTLVGSTLTHEFPIVAVLPTGHSKADTTNQGKTFALRIISQCCVPCIGDPMRASRTASAPAQRATAAPIEEHGTAAYDEFILPNSREHFLDQAGIQNLATGGVATPGRAGENSKGVSLRHPLFISAKVAAFPPDIVNRMVAIFLDELTPETKSGDKELEDVLSGRVSLIMRLSALRLIHRLNLVETVKNMSLISGLWRFNVHLSLVDAMQAKDEAVAYLAAAAKHAEKQRILADASGLSDDIGISESFDPSDLWDNITPRGIDAISTKIFLDAKGQHLLNPNDVLQGLVEDNGRRVLSQVLRDFHLKERAARMCLIQQVRDSLGGWKKKISDQVIWHLDLAQVDPEDGATYFTLRNIAQDNSTPEQTI